MDNVPSSSDDDVEQNVKFIHDTDANGDLGTVCTYVFDSLIRFIVSCPL